MQRKSRCIVGLAFRYGVAYRGRFGSATSCPTNDDLYGGFYERGRRYGSSSSFYRRGRLLNGEAERDRWRKHFFLFFKKTWVISNFFISRTRNSRTQEEVVEVDTVGGGGSRRRPPVVVEVILGRNGRKLDAEDGEEDKEVKEEEGAAIRFPGAKRRSKRSVVDVSSDGEEGVVLEEGILVKEGGGQSRRKPRHYPTR